MPSQFEKYRIRDGVTTLGAATFNAIFKDIDFRLNVLEALNVSWLDAVAKITAQGLLRINESLQPVIDQLTADLDAAEAQIAAISDVATNASVDAKLASPSSITFTYDGTGNVQQQVETIGAVTITTDYTYDGDGNVDTVTTANGTITRTETYTYDGNGVLQSMAAVEV